MKKKDKKQQIKIFLIIIWMITIFYFSHQKGIESSFTSRKVTIFIIKILTGKTIAIDDPFIIGIQLFVRKLAHFSIYATGGILIMNYTYATDKTVRQKILYSICFGVIYAITDEIHQFFIPRRNGNIVDVVIDTLGVTFGVILGYIVLKKVESQSCLRGKQK